MEITKASGKKEPYNRDKFCSSLREVGAPEKVVSEACDVIEKKIDKETSTKEIFRNASHYLLEANLPGALRYNLKKGIIALGPAGFHFEQYVQAIVESQGYETDRNVVMEGECVSHEVDVVARKESEHFLMEMKYRNTQRSKTDIETTMYAHARLLDILPVQERIEIDKNDENALVEHNMWLVTNAKFTSNAIKYGKCRNIRMTGWSYPHGEESLQNIIKKNNLYPVTILPSVGRTILPNFARHNIMLIHDLLPYSEKELETELGLDKRHAKQVSGEIHSLLS